ncbi:MAG: tRNA (pseudouridine(54)-N(1))-methyltransferase TrmY, partial [Thermoplasmata archaeon]|nr:tRNA (pseudouridine(54)-N(1))-methyltransferase TrmY [Thermoplasmata archaeon]
RCINSAFWLSYGIRKNVIFHTILHGEPNPPVYIRIEGERLRKMAPDERNIAIFIKKALERMREDKEIESTPGVFVCKKSFKELLEENKDKDFYLLDEKGEDIESVEISDKPFFFLGDYKDLEKKEKELLFKYGAVPISIGKKSYLSSQCIAILNWILDRRKLD